MKKRVKKLVGLILAVGMMMVFTACGGGGSTQSGNTNTEAGANSNTEADVNSNTEAEAPEAAPAEAKPYKLAVGLAESGASMFTIMSNNIKDYVEVTGGEVVFEGGISASADATVQFVENQIAAGADGIIICPPADSVLPTICQLCEDAGVYWGITFRHVSSEDVAELLNNSQYYLGNCYEADYQSGYDIMSFLNDQGCKKVAMISTPKGNATIDLREEGINKACEDFGMEIVSEARGIEQASDAMITTQSFLSAYEDLDVVFLVGSTGTGITDAMVKAVADANRADQVQVATYEFPEDMVELFEGGIMTTATSIPSWGYDPFAMTVLVANACMGTPVADEPISISIPYLTITDVATAEKWIEGFGTEETRYYDKETIQEQFAKINNSSLDAEQLQERVSDFVKSVSGE